MPRGAKSVSVLLIVTVLAFTLFGCNASDLPPEAPVVDDTNAVDPPPPVLPFTETEDITEFFVEGDVEFLESISKESLVCVQIETSEYAQANETVNLPLPDADTMIVHCTWVSAARTIYIGFINESSDEVYVLSAVGGALTGTLDLTSLPDGEYRPIMYSSDNKSINAVMLYQFQ